MAMTDCPDCAWKVSDRAKECPNCGGVLFEEPDASNVIVRAWTEEANSLRKLGKTIEWCTVVANTLIIIVGIFAVIAGKGPEKLTGIVVIIVGASGITVAQLVRALCDGLAALIEATQAGLRR